MTFATLGWGVWWVAVALRRLAPVQAPTLQFTLWLSVAFALLGLACGIATLRAKLAWILITGVPLFANGSLLLMPLLLRGDEDIT